MSIQQQQGDEERRRAEEEALAESLRIAAYADARSFIDRNAWGGRDLTTYGADMGYEQRLLTKYQTAIIEASQKAKERRK